MIEKPIEFEEKEFLLPVIEECSGYVSVKAYNLEEAMKKFNENIDDYDTLVGFTKPSETIYVDCTLKLVTQNLEKMKEIAICREESK